MPVSALLYTCVKVVKVAPLAGKATLEVDVNF
uniref:Uncharacterized protein n=1 Tax=Cyanothece sp. (strain PCC 7425 / ATCC 29141) TaxID=395961 RepID=B8HLS1_CYAP4